MIPAQHAAKETVNINRKDVSLNFLITTSVSWQKINERGLKRWLGGRNDH
jgi:hypothetical protein